MFIERKFPIEPVTALAKGPTEFSPIANPESNRYQYPACSISSRLSSLIQIPEFSERPRIVPHEVLNGLNVCCSGFSRRIKSVLFIPFQMFWFEYLLFLGSTYRTCSNASTRISASSSAAIPVEQPIEKCARYSINKLLTKIDSFVSVRGLSFQSLFH